MILKTYARVVTENIELTLDMLSHALGLEPEHRFAVGTRQIAVIGDFCVQSAAPDELTALRAVVGPIVVDDLERTVEMLQRQGSTLESEVLAAPTGRVLYSRTPEGVGFEWLEYTRELSAKLLPEVDVTDRP